MDEEDLIQQMLERLRYSGVVDEPGYLGAAKTTYNPFSGLTATSTRISPFAQRALDLQAERAAAAKARNVHTRGFVGGGLGMPEQAVQLRTAKGKTPFVPTSRTSPRTNISASSARPSGYISGVPMDSAPRTITDPIEQQRILDERAKVSPRQGPIPSALKAIAPVAKVAGPIGLAYDVLRSEPAVASTEVPPGGYFYESQAYPSMDNVYTDPTAMAYAGVTPPGEEFGSSYAGPNTMGLTEVAPSMRDVDYSQALADIGVEPSIDVQTQVDTFAGMAEVPSAGSDFFGGGVDAPFDFVDTSPTQAQLDDITRHSGLTFGVPVYTGDWTDIATHIPSQNIREIIRDRHDNISDFLDDETTTDKLQDLVNNQIAIDMLAQSGPVDFDSPAAHALDREFKDNPNVVVNKDSLNAMVELAKKDYYKSEEQVQEAINEIKSGVDTFKDIPAAPAKPAGPTPAEIAAANAASRASTRAAQKAAAAAQRKADLAAQKAAAKAKRDLDKLKAKQTAADKNRIAAAAQEATRRSLEKQMQGWLGRDERDESAMAQIQAALDHIADLQGTGVTSGSTGDRSGEVRDAMRSVGYGGPEWT